MHVSRRARPVRGWVRRFRLRGSLRPQAAAPNRHTRTNDAPLPSHVRSPSARAPSSARTPANAAVRGTSATSPRAARWGCDDGTHLRRSTLPEHTAVRTPRAEAVRNGAPVDLALRDARVATATEGAARRRAVLPVVYGNRARRARIRRGPHRAAQRRPRALHAGRAAVVVLAALEREDRKRDEGEGKGGCALRSKRSAPSTCDCGLRRCSHTARGAVNASTKTKRSPDQPRWATIFFVRTDLRSDVGGVHA